MIILGGLFFLVLGTVSAFFPNGVIELEMMFKAREYEPAESYITRTRFLGVIWMIIGVLFIWLGIATISS
ncbi:hypothetical protein SAMN04488134_103125 [Amphibacillus marinus]|uniref:DUF6199 domain-containing protein n=1 Tax=Amphibacillus marinus TaxID=872970 RepID=A0A1H8L8X5_9BACI|nr:DUF6199 family natural product biosynthesis protein [Amphibacillus marinus]SEO01551.1 hypothetical protein SAMN04488134_103125 [Amphibacillus marinus]